MGRAIYLGRVAVKKRTAGDAALLLPLARSDSPVVLEAVVSLSGAYSQLH